MELASLTPTMPTRSPSQMASASALFVALQAKHAPTAYHCLRVGHNISAWGLYHKLPLDRLAQFEVLGLLHDIGKIGIPERILQKPSKLAPEERSIMAMHPKVGVEILSSAGLVDSLLQSIKRLGQWFDGTGSGDARHPLLKLPLANRILAIADAYDSMISEQRYRPAMSQAEAITELKSKAGTQFDPALVQSFVIVAENYDATLQQAVEARWASYGFQDSVVRLFRNDDALISGGIAANTLASIFHRRLTDHMNDGVIFIDTEGKIVEWNRAAESLSGRKRSTLCHQNWSADLIGLRDEDEKAFAKGKCPLFTVLKTRDYDTRKLTIQHRDGTPRIVRAQLMPITDDKAVLRGAAMIFDDITRQKNLERALHHLHQRAAHDPLTKVCNRAELTLQLPRFAQSAHSGMVAVSVIICDIDFFKRINDTYGHAVGDEALIEFAKILKQCARSTDLVARYGGEEFVIVCGDCGLEDAAKKAEDIRLLLSKSPLAVLRGKCLSASFGVAQILKDQSGDEAINQADSALMRAKQSGRNRVELSSTDTPVVQETQEPSPPPTSSWLSWLGNRPTEFAQSCDILTAVPNDLVVQKISGFLDDWNVEIRNADDRTVSARLDIRRAPNKSRLGDRDVIFDLELMVQEVDYLPTDERMAAKNYTMVSMTLKTSTRRDRRSMAVDELIQRVFESFNGYIVGEMLDAKKRQCIRIHSRR